MSYAKDAFGSNGKHSASSYEALHALCVASRHTLWVNHEEKVAWAWDACQMLCIPYDWAQRLIDAKAVMLDSEGPNLDGDGTKIYVSRAN